MTRFLFFIDSLSTWVGKAFAWLILVLTLGVSYEVFVRYVLRAPTTWAFDFSYITYGAMFLMAGAYTLVAQRACARRRPLPLLAAAHAGDAWTSCSTSSSSCRPSRPASTPAGTTPQISVRFREVSIFSPAGMPVFPLKALIPVTGVLLLLQGIAEIIRCILCIRHGAVAAAPARRGGDGKHHPARAADSRERGEPAPSGQKGA